MRNLFLDSSKPVVLDLFCGLWGWSEGFIAAGWNAIGIDLKHPITIPEHALYAQRDVLSLTRDWLKELLAAYNIRAIVASPPCQEFSYMSMPWSRAKQIEKALLGKGEFPSNYKGGSRTVDQLTKLFRECFRIQRDLCELAGRHVPMVVENVVGAQKWVGKTRHHFGSYYLWGDINESMSLSARMRLPKPGTGERMRSDKQPVSCSQLDTKPATGLPDTLSRSGWPCGYKVPSETGRRTAIGNGARFTSRESAGVKQGGTRRLAASALIAKIPFSLSSYIASILHQ